MKNTYNPWLDNNQIKGIQERILNTEWFYRRTSKIISRFLEEIDIFQKSIVSISIDKETNSISEKTDLIKEKIEQVHNFQLQNIQETLKLLEQEIEEERSKYENNKIYKKSEIISDNIYKKLNAIFEKTKPILQNIHMYINHLNHTWAYIENSIQKNILKRKTEQELIKIISKNPDKKVIYYNKNGERKHNAVLKHIEYYKDQLLAQFEITTKHWRKVKFASWFKDEKEFFDHVRNVPVNIYEPSLEKEYTWKTGNGYVDRLKNITIELSKLKNILQEIRNGFYLR